VTLLEFALYSTDCEKVEIEHWWKNNRQTVTEVAVEKSYPSTTISNTNPTRPAQTLSGRRSSYIPERSGANRILRKLAMSKHTVYQTPPHTHTHTYIYIYIDIRESS
jgi:hypothetical protein